MKGLVLDLRNDPGGLLTAQSRSRRRSSEVAPVVYTDGRTETRRCALRRAKNYFAAQARTTTCRSCRPTSRMCPWWCWSTAAPPPLPRSSRARCRTTSARSIIGTQTFGKGSVQTILPLERHGDQSDHRALLHAERPLHPGHGHRARHRARRWRPRRPLCGCTRPTLPSTSPTIMPGTKHPRLRLRPRYRI